MIMLNVVMLFHHGYHRSPTEIHHASDIQHSAYLQIELGAGAGISCLASLLQLRGTATAQPHHACGVASDVLLFNGELACSAC